MNRRQNIAAERRAPAWNRILRVLPWGFATLAFLALHAQAQVVITSPPEGTISQFTSQAVIGKAPPNLRIRLDVNGVPADSGIVRIDGAFEFLGVPTPRGPVRYTVTARMNNGLAFRADRRIHVLGDPDSIAVEVSSNVIPADGQTVVPVRAWVLDRWKVRIPSEYFVTVEADSIEIVGTDVDPNTPGCQLRLSDGIVTFGLKSAGYVGPVVLTLSTNGVATRGVLHAETPKVPFTLTGSAEGSGKYLGTSGETAGLAPSADFTDGLHGQGRIAAIARGTVFDKYLLTLSLDTDRKLEDRIFRDLDPSTLYSIYGDNSIVTYEAQSSTPLFIKMERNRSYAMYGDYTTLTTGNEYAAYNRSFTGGRVHLDDARNTLDVFGTVTNRKVVQEEIRGQGISGYYYLKQNNVVTGSEKVRIEVRDRFHSEIVLSHTEKARYSDYDIDYVQGSLYFKQPVSSLDGLNNPVYIVVSYEAITTNPDNVVAGGAGEVKLTDALTVGGTAVMEQRDPKNYTLFGGDVQWKLGSLGSLRSEAARSSEEASSGSAWKLEGDITPAKLFTLQPYYRKVDASFDNPTQSGSGREAGTTKYGSTIDAEPVSGTKCRGEFYDQHQSLGSVATTIRSGSGSVEQSLWTNGGASLRLDDVTYLGADPVAPDQGLETHSTIMSGKFHTAVAAGLSTSAEYDRNLRRAETEVSPDALALGMEYQFTPSIGAFAQQKFLQGEGGLTTLGLNTKVGDGTSLYGRYEIGKAIAGDRNAATIGLKNTLKFGDDVTTNFAFEKTKNLSRNLVEVRTDDHDAVSASVEYLPVFPLRTSLKGEFSQDANTIHRGVDFGLSYRVWNDFSLMTKATNVLAESRQQTGHTITAWYLLGFSYRPASSNWLNLIGKVEHRIQDNTIVQPVDEYRTTIATGHAYVEPLHGLEIGLKYALKVARQLSGPDEITTVTDFMLCRPQLDLTRWLNVAAEARLLRQHGANDMKTGYSAEAGIVFIKNTMVSFGYNFQAYRDRDLVEAAYSVRGPYVTLRMKFTEELFGLDGE